jgi:predicted Zn-dependent protease
MRKLIPTVCLLAGLGAAAPSGALDWNKFNPEVLKGMGEKLQALKPVSEQKEIELGKGIAANITGAAPLVNDAELQRYVNNVGLWLAMHTERPDLPWRFGVLDDSMVNAFATPGGYVFITRGLLVLCRDEAELAGILAHEISHVVARHALETMRKGALTGLAGDVLSEYARSKGKEGYTKLVSAGTEIYTRGLDKEDEYAADRAGAVIAARAGYDPYGLPSVLQTIASINPQDDAVALMFKTHPDTGKRLELVLAAMEGRLERYAGQARLPDRFATVMRTHLARYSPARR